KVVDPAPLRQPVLPALLAATPPAAPLPLLGASLLLTGLALGLVGASRGGLGRGHAVRRGPAVRGEEAPVVAVRSLSKRFDGVQALTNVSFTVAAGEAVALWGANGAGKTTVLKCVLGLVSYQGSIQVGAWDAARQGKQARRLLGYVPQDPAFYPDMTVGQTVELFRRLRKVDVGRGADALRTVGLEEQRNKAVRALSGGMKQRLALAVALLGDPPVLLLDEPTANLDASGREAFIGLLKTLKSEGKTLVLTSHRFSEVEALCDRVVALNQGRVEFIAAPHDAARSLGLRTEVRLRVDADVVERAVALLRADGFSVSRNGHGVRVRVDARRKLEPLRLLEGAGVPVEDMDVGDQTWT
ncbi:MAG: ABC transporter ATP-binding protein, partial [Chloroflexota bacterium]